MSYPSAFEALETLYPGALLLSIRQVGATIGRAEQTIRHHLAAGTFPIPLAPASRPRRPLFRMVDVAAFIDSGPLAVAPGTSPVSTPATHPISHPISHPKRGRGRPPKRLQQQEGGAQ